ncbi:hypothetical protein GE061_011812 [Apolygus lucorum]|uniref:Uncharacterized protein n=1 Tax=Apolygus lucorum TaxID=248454 RepID=A0A6A4K0T2_APOLU|nr:hypothetical protein GE061_011812 [Apolygus lucorum]
MSEIFYFNCIRYGFHGQSDEGGDSVCVTAPIKDNQMNYKIFSVLVCLLIVIDTDVGAIWCFQCNSQYHDGCDTLEPYQTSSIFHKLCRDDKNAGREFFCRKVVQTVYDREGLVRVVRSCGYVIDPKNRSCYNYDSSGHKSTSCQCFTDSCNSSSINHWSSLLMSAPALLVLVSRNLL